MGSDPFHLQMAMLLDAAALDVQIPHTRRVSNWLLDVVSILEAKSVLFYLCCPLDPVFQKTQVDFPHRLFCRNCWLLQSSSLRVQ
jgi:hypothetical protein